MRLELRCGSARADASCGGDEEGEGEGGRGGEVAAARLSLADICGKLQFDVSAHCYLKPFVHRCGSAGYMIHYLSSLTRTSSLVLGPRASLEQVVRN